MTDTARLPDLGSAPTATLNLSAIMPSLTVKDVHKSLAWYCDVLGFTVVRRFDRDGALHGAVLRAGDANLIINQDDGAKGFTRVKGEGFSLQLTSRQSVDEVAARIKRNGGAIDTEPADMPWGPRMFRMHDLDGYKFNVSSDWLS